MEQMNDWSQAAHQLQLEQQEQTIAYRCPFCDHLHSTEKSDCDGTDIECCGEVGECVPYTRDDEERDQYEAEMQERDAEYDARNWADYKPTYRTASGGF